MSFLQVIDDLAGGKPMRKTRERQIRKEKKDDRRDGDDELTETVKPDVKLPKQKPFRIIASNSKSDTITTSTTMNTSKDVEVTASMHTSDIALNAKSVYGVLDESVSEKKSAREPYRSLRESVLKEQRKRKKASLRDADDNDESDDDDKIPFVVYIDCFC